MKRIFRISPRTRPGSIMKAIAAKPSLRDFRIRRTLRAAASSLRGFCSRRMVRDAVPARRPLGISLSKVGRLLPLAGWLIAVGAGCGDPSTQRPHQAAAPPPARAPSPKTWTKADKIAAIQRAPISSDQKKAEIAKVEAGQD